MNYFLEKERADSLPKLYTSFIQYLGIFLSLIDQKESDGESIELPIHIPIHGARELLVVPASRPLGKLCGIKGIPRRQ